MTQPRPETVLIGFLTHCSVRRSSNASLFETWGHGVACHWRGSSGCCETFGSSPLSLRGRIRIC